MKWGGVKVPTLTGSFGYKIDNTGSILEPKNVFVSPYLASFKIPVQTPELIPSLLPPAGTDGFGSTWDIFCVDYTHSANTSKDGYSANFTNLASYEANKANTRLGREGVANGLVRYLKAAWLSQEILNTDNTYSGQQKRLDLNGAIWQIMSGNTFYRNGADGWGQYQIDFWASAAQGAYALGQINAANWVVVTDNIGVGRTDGTDHQEFITQVTPEPATMLLLGTGLVVMLLAAGALRRPMA
jgi:hypothetical protein